MPDSPDTPEARWEKAAARHGYEVHPPNARENAMEAAGDALLRENERLRLEVHAAESNGDAFLDEIERLRAQLAEARAALDWIAQESCWDGLSLDGGDLQDEMERRGLMVEVPASDEVREQWDTENMMTWKWRAAGGKG